MRLPSISNRNRGFTLIEILIVVALFAMLVGLGLFMSLEVFRGTLFRTEADTLLSIVERARARSMNNIEETPWSVCYQEDPKAYVTFRGRDFAEGSEGNEVVAGSGDATLSGFPLCGEDAVTFTELSGTTTPRTFAITQGGAVKSISINYEGAILW